MARATGDPTLIARALINQTRSAKSRAEVDGDIVAADEVVGLAEARVDPILRSTGTSAAPVTTSIAATSGPPTSLSGSAEVLAALLPSAAWRQNTLLQRTTLLALSGNRSAATTAMSEAAVLKAGHIEPVVILGCEAMHQLMLFDLYGHVDTRAEEVFRVHDRDVRRGAVAGVAGAEGVRRPVVRRRVERARGAAPLRISTRPPRAVGDGRPLAARLRRHGGEIGRGGVCRARLSRPAPLCRPAQRGRRPQCRTPRRRRARSSRRARRRHRGRGPPRPRCGCARPLDAVAAPARPLSRPPRGRRRAHRRGRRRRAAPGG